ncbi:hypothetical protein, partial [Mycobacterium colombiense]|uniref:hypothetical protein n=1 Tax=Mycobacterium colombiense TaxID=339268 RepID=UPI001C12C7AF
VGVLGQQHIDGLYRLGHRHTSCPASPVITPNANRRPACATVRTVRASGTELFVGSSAGVALAVPLLEAGQEVWR